LTFATGTLRASTVSASLRAGGAELGGCAAGEEGAGVAVPVAVESAVVGAGVAGFDAPDGVPEAGVLCAVPLLEVTVPLSQHPAVRSMTSDAVLSTLTALPLPLSLPLLSALPLALLRGTIRPLLARLARMRRPPHPGVELDA
jgi:hypothetical protein